MSPSSSLAAANPTHEHDTSKKKKKKRKHREEEAAAEPAPPEAEKPRKKKKHRHAVQQVDETPNASTTGASPATQATPLMLDVDGAMPDFDPNSAAAMAGALLSALVAASNSDQPVAGPSNAAAASYPPPPVFPMPADILYNVPPGIIPPDMSFGDPESNELVLKALQDMDLSKLTGLLKSLEGASASANVPFVPPPLVHPIVPTPVGQVPPSAQSILASNSQPLQSSSEGFTSHDHAYLLANKWLNTRQLSALVKSQGLVFKKGKFSALEEQQLSGAIEQYRISKGLSEHQLNDVIFPKDERTRENAFWSEITAAVPQRPIIAVYHHVRRSHHPLRLQGKWTAEEDSRLRTAVMHHGQQWEKVSLDVGRGGADCRDRYRNHIVNKDTRVSGTWSKEEEDELTRIVTEMTVDKGRDADNDVFWSTVARKMGGKRTRAQCRIKWTDSLNLSRKNDGQKPRWGNQDAYILVHKLDALQIRDDSEVDWKTIPDADWNIWSPHVLQRRWQTMKKSVKGYEYMSHQEIMDILKVKKVSSNASGSTRPRKITSAATVDDDSDEEA